MVRREQVLKFCAGLSIAVDVAFSKGRSHADRHVLQCAAKAAHGMAFKMGQYQHGIVPA